MPASLSRKQPVQQESLYRAKRSAAGKKGYATRVERYGDRWWEGPLSQGTAVHEQRAAAGAYQAGLRSPTFDFALSAGQKAKLLALSAEIGVSAAELCRACLTRSLPQVARVHKRVLADKEALRRFTARITRDARAEWEVEE